MHSVCSHHMFTVDLYRCFSILDCWCRVMMNRINSHDDDDDIEINDITTYHTWQSVVTLLELKHTNNTTISWLFSTTNIEWIWNTRSTMVSPETRRGFSVINKRSKPCCYIYITCRITWHPINGWLWYRCRWVIHAYGYKMCTAVDLLCAHVLYVRVTCPLLICFDIDAVLCCCACWCYVFPSFPGFRRYN